MFAKWIGQLESGKARPYWLSYLVLFAVCFLLMSAPYLLAGKGFIWQDDGLEQQWTVFVQYGSWLRDILASIGQGSFAIPLWDTEAGYGQDMLLSLNSAVGNPLNLIAVFATAETAEYFLQATVPLTLGLAGATFSLWARATRSDGFAVLVAALVYVFSGYSVISFSQIFMIYPLVLAPLLVWGADRIFARESPVLFIVAMALLFLYSFSDGWACCLLLVPYCIVRFALLEERRTAKGFLVWLAKFIGCIALAALISAVLLLPSAWDVLNQDRVSLERADSLVYTLSYYARLLQGFLSFTYVGSECYYGYAPLALLCVFSLVVGRKDGRRRMLLGLALLLLAFLLLPLFGRIFNGFAYPNNRWVYAFSLVVAYIVMEELSRVRSLQPRQRRVALVLSAVYVLVGGAVAAAFWLLKGTGQPGFFLLAGIVVVLDVVLVACSREEHPAVQAEGTAPDTRAVPACRTANASRKRLAWKAVALASVVLGIGVAYGTWACFSAAGSTDRQVVLGDAYRRSVDAAAAGTMQDIEGDDWRWDAIGGAIDRRNAGLAVDKDCVSFYNSFYNSAIDRYHSLIGLVGSPYSISFNSLEGRTIPEAFAGVRYIAATAEDGSSVSPLYRKTDGGAVSGAADASAETSATADAEGAAAAATASSTQTAAAGVATAGATDATAVDAATAAAGGSAFDVYEAETVLPLALVYETAIAEDELTSLDSVTASEAMTQAVALAGTDASAAGSSSQDASVHETVEAESIGLASWNASLPATYTVTDAAGNKVAESSAGSLVIDATAGTVRVHVDTVLPAGKECTVTLSGIAFDEDEPVAVGQEEPDVRLDEGTVDIARMTVVFAAERSDGTAATGKALIMQTTSTSSLYSGKDTWTVNLGTAQADRTGIDIEFETPGFYAVADIAVQAEDPQATRTALASLAERGAQDIAFAGNTLTCTATGDEDGSYLFIRLPYSKGWTARVDGAEADVIQADIGFMAVRLTPGTHSVELVYETPCLKEGALLSAVGIAALALLILIQRRRKPRG